MIIYVAGYISLSLIKNIFCEFCTIALNRDRVTSAYLDEISIGVLKTRTSSLSNYSQFPFSVLEVSESIILDVDVPSRIFTQSVLDSLSSKWDHSFVCSNHSNFVCQKASSIIINCFFKNLARDTG